MHGIEDPKRAATLRAMSPAVLHAMRRNPPKVFRLATAVSHARSISKSLVNRLPGSAHGTWATTTPCSAHATRGAMGSTPIAAEVLVAPSPFAAPVVVFGALAPATRATQRALPAPHPDHRDGSRTQRRVVDGHVLDDHALDVQQSFESALQPRRFPRLYFLVEKQTYRKRPSHIGIQRLTDEPPPTKTTQEPQNKDSRRNRWRQSNVGSPPKPSSTIIADQKPA